MGSPCQVLQIPQWAALFTSRHLPFLVSWFFPASLSSSKAAVSPSRMTPHTVGFKQHVSITKANSWINTFPNYDVQSHAEQTQKLCKNFAFIEIAMTGARQSKQQERGHEGRLAREMWGGGSGLCSWSDLPYSVAGLCKASICMSPLCISHSRGCFWNICVARETI